MPHPRILGAPRLLILGAAILALLALAVLAVWLTRPAPPRFPPGPLATEQYPRPAPNNRRGLHWIPTTRQSAPDIDRFAREARWMGVRWVVFLNQDANIGDNDYLVRQLTANGITPIMRVLTHRGAPIRGDLAAMVRHYTALGVFYYQLYNEPNLPSENQDRPPSVDRYLDLWLPAARQVTAAGGLPGIGSLSPGAEVDDLVFLRATLRGIKGRGQADALDHAWVGVHDYLLDGAGTPVARDRGFRRPALYDGIVRAELGRELPLIGTEGGFPADRPAQVWREETWRVLDAFRLVERSPRPYEFAYTYWLIANEAGGGSDPNFTRQALFTASGHSPLVDALRRADETATTADDSAAGS